VTISQKSQYAVRALLGLAQYQGTGPVKAARIASAQSIPLRFLENILGELKQARLVESVRGKEGGYLLRGQPEAISVGDVIRLTEGPMHPAGRVAGRSVAEGRTRDLGGVLLPVWEKAQKAMMDVYDQTTLRDLLEHELAARESSGLNYAI
jgi:Rrf2 family protein